MKIVKPLLIRTLQLVSVLVAIVFLISGYSSYISPETHPILACLGLFFPFFAVGNFILAIFWLLVRWRFFLFYIAVFVMGWAPFSCYCPLNLHQVDEAKDDIKVLSYNVMCFYSDNKDTKKTSLDYVLNSDADIICLQEFPASNKDVSAKLKKFPYSKIVKISASTAIALCSKYPIVSTKKADFGDSFNGACLFKVRKDRKLLSVLNLHLESNKLDNEDKQVYKGLLKHPTEETMRKDGKPLLAKYAGAAAIRHRQAKILSDLLKKDNNTDLIVCGDFNDSPISSSHRILSEGLTDAYRECGFGPGFSYNRSFMFFRIDNIFVSNSFDVKSCKVDRSIDDSDHYPIWCVLANKNK